MEGKIQQALDADSKIIKQDDKSLDENSINQILKKLYQSGFFKDVAVKIENMNLIIDVIEKEIAQELVKNKSTKKTISNNNITISIVYKLNVPYSQFPSATTP